MKPRNAKRLMTVLLIASPRLLLITPFVLWSVMPLILLSKLSIDFDLSRAPASALGRLVDQATRSLAATNRAARSARGSGGCVGSGRALLIFAISAGCYQAERRADRGSARRSGDALAEGALRPFGQAADRVRAILRRCRPRAEIARALR